MASKGPDGVVRQFRTLFDAGALGGLSDGELLGRFVARRDEDAFAALVARHGPMVLAVGRALLGDEADAEDAFQATFLVLARRAGSIGRPDLLGHWLYGVARHAARKTRARAARRRRREVREVAMEGACEAGRHERGPLVRELVEALHEEIGRLPDSYRAPVVLCDLQGLTRDEAARRLGWPVGTVNGRLSRARDRLRDRLTRRGFSLPAGLVVLTLASGAKAAVPPALATATIRAAIHFAAGRALAAGVVSAPVAAVTKGVLQAMSSTKLAGVALTLALLALGTTHALSGGQAAPGEPQRRAARAEAEAARAEAEAARAEARAARAEARAARAEARAARAEDPRADPAALELPGRTAYDADAMIQVRPRFLSLVVKVDVQLGQVVKKGDALLDVYSADLAEAKGVYEEKKSQWEHDKTQLDRSDRLYHAVPPALSETDYLDDVNDEKKSRHGLQIAKDKLLFQFGLSEAQIEDIKNQSGEQRARVTLRAAADGYVVKRDVVQGNLYDVSNVLLVIAPADHYWVWADVRDEDLSRVNVGQRCEIRIMDLNLHSKIDLIAHRVNPDDEAARIRATIPNPRGQLRPDMLGTVTVGGRE
jgi:RNA polymerase sigma factor (sigma-70 family)